eukprot:1961926-Rhodomonas_salina.1
MRRPSACRPSTRTTQRAGCGRCWRVTAYTTPPHAGRGSDSPPRHRQALVYVRRSGLTHAQDPARSVIQSKPQCFEPPSRAPPSDHSRVGRGGLFERERVYLHLHADPFAAYIATSTDSRHGGAKTAAGSLNRAGAG